jgi:UV DNA damage endonuclease
VIRLGYACINTTLPSSNKTCRVSNATPERVIALGRQNLLALAEILRWNWAHGIAVFRLSSEIIPLASHPAVRGIPWERELSAELARVGTLIRESGARVSMHPGQYTVLNSPRAEVVEASLAEMDYHARLLDLLGTGPSARIILHLGGVYGDKAGSMARFIQNFKLLSPSAQARLVLENDEKNYTAADALALSADTGAPVVFDVFHHSYNPSLENLSLRALIERCAATWREEEGPPKLHYSDQWPGKPPGSHSQSVDSAAFRRFYEILGGLDADVMLEVKDKEQSVLALYRDYPELRVI